MKPLAVLILALLLAGCSPPQYEYQTLTWWKAAASSGAKMRLIHHSDGYDYPEEVLGEESMLTKLGAHGWELVTIQPGPHGREFFLKRTKRKGYDYWTLDFTRAPAPR
jgi:hypothetical protein